MQKPRNLIVVRYKDGRTAKGYTQDFMPGKETFHLISEQQADGGTVHAVRLSELKAVFFVKTLAGNRAYQHKKRFEEIDDSRLRGLKIRVEFHDGEVIRGITLGYHKDKRGFFINDIDPMSNNERIYVVADAVKDVKLRESAEQ